MEEIVKEDMLTELLSAFSKKAFDACTTEPSKLDITTMEKVEILMQQDYSLFEIDNSGGVLSGCYPPRILVPEYEHNGIAKKHTANSVSRQNGSSNGSNTNGSGGGDTSNGDSIIQKTQQQTSERSSNTSTTPVIEDNEKKNGNSNGNSNGNGFDTCPENGSDGDSGVQSFVRVASKPARPQRPQKTIYEEVYDANKMREFITRARYARCRQRFVVPVILCRGKFICRSATVSVVQETYINFGRDYLSGNGNETQQRTVDVENESLGNSINDPPSPFSYREVIKNDIGLLKTLNIKTIVDLMVEKRKVKFFVAISSSEKADPQHYEQFNLLSLPYPGCEFYKKFRDHNYIASNLYYNWEKSFNDADISIPAGPAMDLDINWDEYRKWDLVEITQNYLKAILKYVQEETGGLLVHCISGWDRTPLFISLLRLSLWADGLIHKSLDVLEITYLTVAYDWYLFGHQLPDREKKGEDIILFCFHMLKFLGSEEFSLVEHRKRTKTTSSSSSIGLISKPEDDAKLREELYAAACEQDSNDSFSGTSNCDVQLTDAVSAMTLPCASIQANECNNTLTSRSPNSRRSRTSPMPVPGANASRQRHESVSSNSSWHVVTETGSIDSVLAGSYMRHYLAERSENSSVTSNNSIPSSNRSSSGSNGNSGSDTLDCGVSPHNTSGGSDNSQNSGESYKSALSDPNSGNNGALPTTAEGVQSDCSTDLADSAPSSNGRRGATEREKRLNSVRAVLIRNYGKGVGLKLRDGSGLSIGTFIGTLF
ncbi:myotubularin-related protein 14 isoform X2 [Ceratitis capitata]|uniref:myotubularin-related protein 14 isoform X2 n=1 Tax=Ceratitis capitata TaxID=7213 RepID=UPI000329E9A4|nr:myotubularin-related protein 14 isoform X2 [Ceratitis capitata]